MSTSSASFLTRLYYEFTSSLKANEFANMPEANKDEGSIRFETRKLII